MESTGKTLWDFSQNDYLAHNKIKYKNAQSGICYGFVVALYKFLKHKKYLPNKTKYENFVKENISLIWQAFDVQQDRAQLERYLGGETNIWKKQFDTLTEAETFLKSLLACNEYVSVSIAELPTPIGGVWAGHALSFISDCKAQKCVSVNLNPSFI
jgi:hypothetical protein